MVNVGQGVCDDYSDAYEELRRRLYAEIERRVSSPQESSEQIARKAELAKCAGRGIGIRWSVTAFGAADCKIFSPISPGV